MESKEAVVDEIVDLIKKSKDREKEGRNEPVIGLCEDVIIKGSKKEKKVRAKVDTGASNSSISVKLFSEIGKTPVIRRVIVERAHEEEKRPLVKLWIKHKYAKKWIESEFTVSHRENMEYEVLIGDNTLRKMHVLINPEKD